jgi:hypothetical protein
VIRISGGKVLDENPKGGKYQVQNGNCRNFPTTNHASGDITSFGLQTNMFTGEQRDGDEMK